MRQSVTTFLRKHAVAVLFGATLAIAAAIVISCGGRFSATSNNGMGTLNVSVSDPPSCLAPAGAAAAPAGTFKSVFITIRSIQAHTSGTADASSPGWQELAPQLVSAPRQVDLLQLPATGNGVQCLLEQLGSTTLPAGDYQQIRLILLANAATSMSPASNGCSSLGNVFNCVVDGSGTHTLDLSSEATTGLKIPPGQVVGGPIHVAAGQSVDLNIDFNTCASLIQQGNGDFRLKPTLTAGVVSTGPGRIFGQIVDSATMQPIAGAIVTLQFADMSGTDRIAMQEVTDSSGNFSFCPLASGAMFDVVTDAITSSGTAYDVTVVFNVPGGTNLGAIPLIAETAATAGASTGPGTITGTVTAIVSGTTGASVDASVSALESVTVASVSHTITTPLLPNSTTFPLAIDSSSSCPANSPMGAFCGSYTLIVPASNPNVGTFSAGKTTFTAPASGDVLYTVEADATKPMSGGAAICTPATQTTMPLKVTAGATTTAARLDFTGCS